MQDRDEDLEMLPAGHLFGTNTTKIGKKDAYLHAYTYSFELLHQP
jgi:LysR family cys regulon transcriptional activator